MSRKRRKRRLINNRLARLVMAVFLVIFLAVSGYKLYEVNSDTLETVTALEETARTTYDTTAFILKDEEVISESIDGYAVPFVGEGEKVNCNAEIAVVFPDKESAVSYTEIESLRSRYDRYKKLSEGTEYSMMRIDYLADGAKKDLCGFIDSVKSGKIPEGMEYAEDFLDKETAFDMTVNGNIDFSDDMLSISAKIKNLESAMSGGVTLTTGIESPGYYFSTTDGLENELSYKDVKKILPDDLRKALGKTPVESDGTAGKIVKSYVWYIVFEIDIKTTDFFFENIGKSIMVDFSGLSVDEVKTVIHSVNTHDGSGSVVVLKCTTVSEELLSLRKADISVILREDTGYRIPSSAVRTVVGEDGEEIKGVFILRGDVINFRKLDVIYTDKDYVLTSERTEKSYVKLYDEIIMGGKELHDGDLIYN